MASMVDRVLLMGAAAALMIPEVQIGMNDLGLYVNLSGAILFGVLVTLNWKKG